MRIAALMLSLGLLVVLTPAGAPLAAPRPAPRRERVLVERRLGADRVQLIRRADGSWRLRRLGRTGPRDLVCGALRGAWGLWVTDVNGDRRPDLVVALRKRARHDPVVANRPHVYTLVGDRCVPLWRGTRLAGRFDALQVRGPTLWALERVGRGQRRVARYRWQGFGYTVERVLWQGRRIPARWTRFFRTGRR